MVLQCAPVKPVSSNTSAAASTLAKSGTTQKPSTAQAAQPSELKKRQLVLDNSPPPVKGQNPDGSYKLNPDGSYTFVKGEGNPEMLRKIRALSAAKALKKAKAEANLKKWKAKQKTMVRGGGRAPKPDSSWTFYDPELKVTKTEDLLAKRTAIPMADDGNDSRLEKRVVPGPQYLLARKPRTTVGAKTTTKVYTDGHNKVTVTALAKRTAAPTDDDSDVEDLTARDLYDDNEEPTTTSPSLAKRVTKCERNPFLPKWLCPDAREIKYKMYTIVKNYGDHGQYSKTVSIPVVKRSAAPELDEAANEDDTSLDKREPDVYEIVEDLGDGKMETHTVTLPDFAKRSVDPEAEPNQHETLGTPPPPANTPKHYKRSEDDPEGVYEIVEEFEDGRKKTQTVQLPVATDAPGKDITADVERVLETDKEPIDVEPADASLDKRQMSSLYVSKTQWDALIKKYNKLLKINNSDVDETLDGDLEKRQMSSLYVSMTQYDAMIKKYTQLLRTQGVQKHEIDDETTSPADSSSADLKKREASLLGPGGAMTRGWRSYFDMVEKMKRIRGKNYPKLPKGVYKREADANHEIADADLEKREASLLGPGGAMTRGWRSYFDMVEKMKRIRGKNYPKLPKGVYKREAEADHADAELENRQISDLYVSKSQYDAMVKKYAALLNTAGVHKRAVEEVEASLKKRLMSSLYVSKSQWDALIKKYSKLFAANGQKIPTVPKGVYKREAEAGKVLTLGELGPGGAMTGGWRSYLDMVEKMKRIRGKNYPKLPAGVYKREYLGTVHRSSPTGATSHVYKRHPVVDANTPLSVYFSYYGICAAGANTICDREEMGGLSQSADPFDIVGLAGDLQSTLAPAVTITALVLLGVSWLLYIYICVRPATRRCRKLFFATSGCAVVALLHSASVLNTVGQTAVDVLSTTEAKGGVVLVARKGGRVVAVGVVAAVLAACALGAVAAGDRSGEDKRREDEEKNATDEIVDIYASMNTPKLRKEWGVKKDGVELPRGNVAPAPMWGTMRGGVV